jgi:protein SCO1/2
MRPPSIKPARRTEWLVWGGLALIIAAIGGAFAWSRLNAATPLPVLGQISDFQLTNQFSQPVSLADLRGNVWLADIVFTRCPGPCPTMSHEMAEMQSQLQTALPPNSPVRLVTLTSDPDFDTPPVLKKYAERFGADSNRWIFLTGPRPDIRKLAVNDFKFVVVDKPAADRAIPNDLFIHSIFFVLVDQQGRVRGWTDRDGSLHAYYDSQDDAARAQIIPAINQLLREK